MTGKIQSVTELIPEKHFTSRRHSNNSSNSDQPKPGTSAQAKESEKMSEEDLVIKGVILVH